MNRVEEILLRLYDFMGFKKDLEFCEKFDIKANTLSTWKKRGTIPYDLLEKISQNENISLDWLVFGNKEIKVNDKRLKTSSLVAPINNSLIYLGTFFLT